MINSFFSSPATLVKRQEEEKSLAWDGGSERSKSDLIDHSVVTSCNDIESFLNLDSLPSILRMCTNYLSRFSVFVHGSCAGFFIDRVPVSQNLPSLALDTVYSTREDGKSIFCLGRRQAM